MGFSRFFSEQAQKPSGLFGRIVMSAFFNYGNAFQNRIAQEIISVQENDHILEIGFGTGKLVNEMAKQINTGHIEGIDFSDTMVSVAQRKNRKNIMNGKVKIIKGDFEKNSYEKNTFTKIYSVNTVYFWQNPENTAKKIFDILKPNGKCVLAFVDNKQLEQSNLDKKIFHLYSQNDIRDLLMNAGFTQDVKIETKARGAYNYHFAVAIK